MRQVLALAISLLFGAGSNAQQQPELLAPVTPLATISHVPNGKSKPQLATHQTFHGKTGDALRMFSDADVTYAIPPRTMAFVGAIAFNDFRSFEPESAGALARLFVRLLVDGKPAMSIAMDHQTPLTRFNVPVAGGHTLTISADGEFASDFYLFNAAFSSGVQKPNQAYVLAPGEGYVSAASVARHSMYHAYHPDETVSVTVASGSPVSSSEVELRLTPEHAAFTATDFRATVPMRASSEGTYEGTTPWKVPAQRGPAQLEITARVSNRIIYHEQRRIAIIAETDLARVSNSFFGVHTSTAGYLVLQDEFASVWGAKWARVLLRWPIIERQAGKYDFSYIEPVLDAYRGQHMHILAVLGENAPSWAGQVGPQYYARWKQWVAETVRRLQPKVDAWDLFNEIDVKYYGSWRNVDPNADISILQAGIDAIRSVSKTAQIVCCSTGTYGWLSYDKRIFDAGILNQIDVVSLHPYMQYAPEYKDPVFNYPDKLTALEQLIQSYGLSKSNWSTEAAWIRGARGGSDVTAPDIDEHTQAQYGVRANLLTAARAVPYFTHMPMNHYHHLPLQLDALSGFANVTSLLSAAEGGGRSLVHTPGVWAFAWDTCTGVVGALWTDQKKGEVAISGLAGSEFLDMYGNSIDIQPAAVSLSPDPIYFVASTGVSPRVDVKSAPASPQWTALPELTTWKRVSTSRYSEIPGGLHVSSFPTTYGYQLISPTVAVRPDTCYLGRIGLRLNHGGISFFPQDAVSSINLGEGYHFSLLALPNGVPQEAVIRFKTNDTAQAKFVIAGNNPYSASVSDFIVSDPLIAPCRE
jgi:hypothetical protein